MIISGREIKNQVNKNILIKPFDEQQINPNSYNLRLHNELLIYENDVLDMKIENQTKTLKIPKEGLILEPGKLYLGRTQEYTETYNLIPTLEGRSSVGRLGLSIHISSPYGNVGFKGFWTLEISCVQPIRIYAGINICQIYYHQIHGEYDTYSSNKYQANNGVQGSMLYKDFLVDK
ncbi:MAG: dCTP deaminase [Bacillota bacterium]